MEQDIIISHKFRNLLHTILLFAGMIGLLALLGLSLAGVSGLVWAIIIGLIFLFLGQRISSQLILNMYRARALSRQDAPQLYQLIQELARRASLTNMPRLYYIPSRMMNAFAVGKRSDAAIGITDGLLRGLNMRELTGVLAHEMSHISNNDMRAMAFADVISRMTGLFSSIGQFLLLLNLPLLLMGMAAIPWLTVILLIAAPTLSTLLQLALSRTREFEADFNAARLTGDPQGLASALQKLEYFESNILKRIFMPGHSVPDPSVFRTHPNTNERVRRLLELTGEEQPWVVPETEELELPTHISQIRQNPRWRMMRGLWY